MANEGRRRKIEMKKITKKQSLDVTFAKRRQGLLNKAGELCVLCGAEVAVVGFYPAGKPFAFGHPSVDNVIDRCLSDSNNNGNVNADQVEKSRKQYMEALAKLEHQKKLLDSISKDHEKEAASGRDTFWWDDPVESMDSEELEQYAASLEELKKNVLVRVDEMEKANNSPSRFLLLEDDQ